MKLGCNGVVRLLRCLVLGFSILPATAVVFYATGDPAHNTTAPTGALAGSGWELQGATFPGTPIAPQFFITATHVGGKVGDTFSFRGVNYPMIASFSHPDADITIWKVAGSFPQYANVYAAQNEVGQPIIVFGRGCPRGEEIRLNGQLKGWAWGEPDGVLRWGQNVVAAISDADEQPATGTTKVQLLRMNFDANGGPNEAHLAGGDSGGGLFIRDGAAWKLAGIVHAANKTYRTSAGAPKFDATLFDEGGLFEGEDGEEQFRQFHAPNAQPGSFYATRLSAYNGWIQSVLESPNTSRTVL